jgi:transcriptional regulator with XRE-family HTH domain
MPESFGARLRQQREERRIDLSWIAEQTKIKRSLLDALERDDVSHWPAGIFRRAYIRTYAHIIGLDPDAVLREFLALYPEPVDAFEAAEAAAVEEAARRQSAPAIRLRNIVDSAIGSLARLRRPGGMDEPPTARMAEPRAPVPRQAAPATLDQRDEPEHWQRPQFAPETPASPPEHLPPPSPYTHGVDPSSETMAGIDGSRAPAPQAADVSAADDAYDVVSESPVEDVQADAPAADEGVSESRLDGVATLCTLLGRTEDRDEILLLLDEAARALDARGLIVWLWDQRTEALLPALVHGYSDQVLAQLPSVGRNADNATAAAFRSATACEVAASAHATSALVLPLLIPEGCAGVLAVELQAGIRASAVRPVATIVAAALAQLVRRSRFGRVGPAAGLPKRS